MTVFVIFFTQVNSIQAHAEEEMKRMSDKWKKKEAKMKKNNVAEKEKVRVENNFVVCWSCWTCALTNVFFSYFLTVRGYVETVQRGS
jgi:hypothetical protein